MLAKISNFVKKYRTEILLFIIMVLLVLFSFACGFIIGKYQSKTPIEIINNI